MYSMYYTEEQLKFLADHHGLNISFGEGIIFVETPVSSWRLMHDNSEVLKVLHQNYRGFHTSYSGRFGSGYHIQKLKDYSYGSVFSYIHRHDSNFLCSQRRQELYL